MKDKMCITVIVILGVLLIVQTAYVISLERNQQILLARPRFQRGLTGIRLQDRMSPSVREPLPEKGPTMITALFTMRSLPKEYLVVMDLPGLSKDEIKIEVKNNYLRVSAKKKTMKKEKGKHFRQEEVSSSSFQQVIALPEDCLKRKIAYEYKDGKLTIHMPKNPRMQKGTKAIK